MTRRLQSDASGRPRLTGMAGSAVVLFIVGLWVGLVWPLGPLPHVVVGVLRAVPFTFFLILLQIALGVVITGKDAAAEIRCRTCVFCVAAVLMMAMGSISLEVVTASGEGSWRVARRVLLLGAVPLLIGLCVHSGLYAALALRRLKPSVRNVIGSYLVVGVLALGASSTAAVLGVCIRTQNREIVKQRDACAALWRATDRMTQRFLEECPGDYRFLLLRGTFLQDSGRQTEAETMCRQVCEAPGTPAYIRQGLESEMARMHQRAAGHVR